MPTLILTVPDDRNEEKVITVLAELAHKGFVAEFETRCV
jgi:hypothetical protein